jgi:acylphosphatase
MRRLTAYISGKVQRSGYRGKVVTIARALGLYGVVQDLPDGRVKVIAEGEEADLERLANALMMKNSAIDLTNIEKYYAESTDSFSGFYRMVEEWEFYSVEDCLNVLVDLKKEELAGQDLMLEKLSKWLER